MSRSILDPAVQQWTDYQLHNLLFFQGSLEEKQRLFKMIWDQRDNNAIVLTYLHDIAVVWFGHDSRQVLDVVDFFRDRRIRGEANHAPPGPAMDSHETHSIGADHMSWLFDQATNSDNVPPHLGPVASRVNPYILDLL